MPGYSRSSIIAACPMTFISSIRLTQFSTTQWYKVDMLQYYYYGIEDVGCGQSKLLALGRVELLKNSYSTNRLILNVSDIVYTSEFDKVFEDKDNYNLSCYLCSRVPAPTSLQLVISSEKYMVRAAIQLGSNGKNTKAQKADT